MTAVPPSAPPDPELGVPRERFVRFRTRLIAYLSVWLLHVLVVEIWSYVVTANDVTHVSVWRKIAMPLMILVVGGARALAAPWVDRITRFDTPGFAFLILAAASCLIAICVLCLRSRTTPPLIFALCLHAASFVVAFIFFCLLVVENADE